MSYELRVTGSMFVIANEVKPKLRAEAKQTIGAK